MGRPRDPTRVQPTGIMATFGERVRDLRTAAGMTQNELSRASGVSSVYLGTIERGEKVASIDTVEKVAQGLGVEPGDLLRASDGRGRATAAEKLGNKVASLARTASEDRIECFGKIAKLFFEEAAEAPAGKRRDRLTKRQSQAAAKRAAQSARPRSSAT